MKTLRWTPAILSSIVLIILASLLLGVRLQSDGMILRVKSVESATYISIAIAAAVVFIFQLFRNFLDQGFASLKQKLPAVPVHAAKPAYFDKARRLAICFAVAALFVWPFYASRGAIDLATLTLIYVMLGLGLNVVVGLAGLLDLGYVGFYAVGAYGYALLNQYLVLISGQGC